MCEPPTELKHNAARESSSRSHDIATLYDWIDSTITALLPSRYSSMTGAPTRTLHARILILDDNCFGLSARKGVLHELGHEVVTSSSPQEALEICARQAFDVIVTDYRMPDMDGIEFISQLRQQGIQVPVVLISGFTDTLGLNEENTGADVVLQKSANEVPHLIRSVNAILRKQLAKKPPGSQGPSKNSKRKMP
jgi:CheY-like chemotaxis protein